MKMLQGHSRKKLYVYIGVFLSTLITVFTSASLPVSAIGEEYIRIDETNIRIEDGILAQPGRLDRVGTVNGRERYSGGVTLQGVPGIRISGEGTCDYTLVIEVRGDQVSIVQVTQSATSSPGCEIPDVGDGGTNIARQLSQNITLTQPGTNPNPGPPPPPPIGTENIVPIGCPDSYAPRTPPPAICANIPKGCPGATEFSRDRILDEACPYVAAPNFICPAGYRPNVQFQACVAAVNVNGTCPGDGVVVAGPNGGQICRANGTAAVFNGDDPKCAIVGYGPVRCPINDPAIAPREIGCYVKDASAPNPADRVYKEASCADPAFNPPSNDPCSSELPVAVRDASCGAANCTVNCNLVQKYIDPAVEALTALVGVGVAIAIIWGGIQYSRSANDPRVVAAAKRRITVALLVLVGFLLFSRFLDWIVPGGIGI